MAGIYIHIPFCKTRCIYCDFYSTTRSDLKERYIRALCRELRIRKDYLEGAMKRTSGRCLLLSKRFTAWNIARKLLSRPTRMT